VTILRTVERLMLSEQTGSWYMQWRRTQVISNRPPSSRSNVVTSRCYANRGKRHLCESAENEAVIPAATTTSESILPRPLECPILSKAAAKILVGGDGHPARITNHLVVQKGPKCRPRSFSRRKISGWAAL